MIKFAKEDDPKKAKLFTRGTVKDIDLDKEKEWIETIRIYSFKLTYESFHDPRRANLRRSLEEYRVELNLSIYRKIPSHVSATIEHILLFGESLDEFFKDLGIEKRLPDEIGDKLLYYRAFEYHNKERGILLGVE